MPKKNKSVEATPLSQIPDYYVGGGLLLLAAFAILILATMSGCNAGETYQLLGYDAIDAAAVESAKGVTAYDVAIRAGIARNRAEYLAKLGRDVSRIALARGKVVRQDGSVADMTKADAEKFATDITAAAERHIAGTSEQERRRAEWLAVTTDNLKYIRDVCADSRAFVLYRSNVDAQWKHYLQSQARNRLAKMGAQTNGRSTETATPLTWRP